MKQGQFKTNMKIYAYIMMGLLCILLLRLAIVQIFYADQYQIKASENRIRLVPIRASRGEIYARNGETLAANELVYTLSLTYLGADNQDVMIEKLVEILNPYYPEITAQLIKEKIELQKFRLFEPVVVMRDIPWDLVVKIEENRQHLPGVTINTEPLRVYPEEAMAGHVLGYIHSINAEELAKSGNQYSINSLIGKSGIEKQYEKELRGKDGARRVEVDAQGRPVGELVTLQPQPGNNLTLTLDFKLQKVMEKSMEDNLLRLQKKYAKAKVGSAVVLDVKSGEVLAMTSSPVLRPDDFKGQLDNDLAPYYFPSGSQYNPLEPGAATNRAIQAHYPPGSTFKPVTGMAALEAGKIDPFAYEVNCKGAYWIDPFIRCTAAHGNENYFSGMADSCNTYFQEAGRRAGKENIIKVAKDFGLGQKTGIDLPSETTGLVPTPAWKKELYDILINQKYDYLRKQLNEKYARLLADAKDEEAKKSIQKAEKNEKARLEAQYHIDYNFETTWQAFDTFNMSIGQGGNQYSVIQLANYAAAIANGGYLMEPHLLKSISSSDNKKNQEIKPKLIHETAVSAKTLALTRQAMMAVTQKGGTAWFLFTNFPPEVTVAAKTGTAETSRVGDRKDSEFHGTFIAFAPADDPQIAFAGVVEYGQHGSESAGWVAKAIFEQYFGIVDHYTALKAEEDKKKADAGSLAGNPVEKGKVSVDADDTSPTR